MNNSKLVNLTFLEKKVSYLKKQKKSIGLCHGVFDLLHLGHIKHFEEAKKKVDILIVSVTDDRYVNKGPGRPSFNNLQRSEALSAINFIDYVVISSFPTAIKMLATIKPNIFFKGPDYKNINKDITGQIKKEINVLKKNKGKIYFTTSDKFSSSVLLKKYFGLLSEKQSKIVSKISKLYSIEKIKSEIDNFKKIRPLVIGESIIDQYHYTETLGKSGKEPVLVIRDKKVERYLGGAGAVCRHLSEFVLRGNFVSYLGKNKSNNKFILNNLPKKFKINKITRKNVPTILKRRFIDDISKTKIIGNYEVDDRLLNSKEEVLLKKIFFKSSKLSDLIIISDYGHGLIDENFAKTICNQKKFISVNVQINSSNLGYHSLKNYKNVDCIIINESELRYELRSKIGKLEELMKKLSSTLNTKYLVVTRGASGSIMYVRKNKKYYYCDGLATKVIDKVGAGDAMLSIITLCLYNKLDYNLSLLIASLCAAQSVNTIGNKESINKIQLLKDLEHLI